MSDHDLLAVYIALGVVTLLAAGALLVTLSQPVLYRLGWW